MVLCLFHIGKHANILTTLPIISHTGLQMVPLPVEIRAQHTAMITYKSNRGWCNRDTERKDSKRMKGGGVSGGINKR